MGRTRESPYCCDHPKSPERHVEGCPSLRPTHCALCGLGFDIEEPTEKFAIWLNGRGWVIDTDGTEAAVAERLHGATWFGNEDEAIAVLDRLAGTNDRSEVGTVVTL